MFITHEFQQQSLGKRPVDRQTSLGGLYVCLEEGGSIQRTIT